MNTKVIHAPSNKNTAILIRIKTELSIREIYDITQEKQHPNLSSQTQAVLTIKWIFQAYPFLQHQNLSFKVISVLFHFVWYQRSNRRSRFNVGVKQRAKAAVPSSRVTILYCLLEFGFLFLAQSLPFPKELPFGVCLY